MVRVLSILLLCWNVTAADLYYAQSNIGSGDGSSAGNAKAIASVNLTTQSPGDRYFQVGTVTTTVTLGSSGTPPLPITLIGLSGAKMSQPNGNLLSIAVSNIVITNMLFENTDTGSGLTFSNAARLIDATSAINLTVANCIFQNEYVHTNPIDHNPDIANGGGIYANGLQGTNLITGCWFSNVGWCVSCLSPCDFFTTSNCYFTHFDHGVVPHATNWIVANCTFGTTSNWDTAANSYHHDGIHFYDTGNVTKNGRIEANLFSEDWGGHMTAYIFLETAPSNVLADNNVFLVQGSTVLNNGCVVAYGASNQWVNNTFAGNGGGSCFFGGGTNALFANNVFNSFTTFIDQQTTTTTTQFSNNIYAGQVPGGNAPWISGASSYNLFSDWTTASGEQNSISTSAAVINGAGRPLGTGAAVGAGLNFSSLFASDFDGNARPSSGVWADGAFQTNRIRYVGAKR